MVDHADLAGAGGHRLEQLDVVGVDVGVGSPAAQHLDRRVLAVGGDHAGDERLLVVVVGVAQAEPAFPLRLGQLLVGRRARRPRRPCRCCRRSCGPARRGRTSGPRRRCSCCGDRLVEDGRVERLEQAVLGGGPEVAGVDGQVDVGLGVLSLGGDPLAELGVVPGEELDIDPGLLRPRLERGLDAVVAPGVHGQLLAVVAAAPGDDGGGRPARSSASASQPAEIRRSHQVATLEDVGRSDTRQAPAGIGR